MLGEALVSSRASLNLLMKILSRPARIELGTHPPHLVIDQVDASRNNQT